jgi:hypothetical protein
MMLQMFQPVAERARPNEVGACAAYMHSNVHVHASTQPKDYGHMNEPNPPMRGHVGGCETSGSSTTLAPTWYSLTALTETEAERELRPTGSP